MGYKVNQDTETVGNGGNYLSAGIHGPVALTDVQYENITENSDNKVLAFYFKSKDQKEARIIMFEPNLDFDNEPDRTISRLAQIAKSVTSDKFEVDGDDWESFAENFAEFIQGYITNDKNTPKQWLKLRFNKKNYVEFGTGEFILPYNKEEKAPLEQLEYDKFEKTEAPKTEAPSLEEEPAEDDVF